MKSRGIDDLLTQLSLVLDLEGDIIECGSSRCGTSIVMANKLRLNKVKKLVYACDSFKGFDKGELQRERLSGLTKVPDRAYTSTSYEYVMKKISKLGVEDTVIPVKGYFEDTLPNIKSIFCFAFIDCDLKESTIYAAETIWPNLTNGGRMVFDDFNCEVYRGARIGIEYFVNKYINEISSNGLLNRLYYIEKK